MAIIKPFRALRPNPNVAVRLASRPYDVLNREEARREAEGFPESFYHISRAEIDLPDRVDIHDKKVYKKAAENLKKFIEKGYLFREEKPCYYIYQLVMDGRSQTGIVAVSSVVDYEEGIIKKHELTRPEKEKDRINHILATKAQTGNVFLAYRANDHLNNLVSNVKSSQKPVYDFTSIDGVKHSVWVVDKEDRIEEITRLFKEEVPHTYIADGHHRAASAANAAKRISGKRFNTDAASSYFLTTLFPDSELEIIDYNRLLKDLNGHSKEEFLEELKKDFDVEVVGKQPVKPEATHVFGMYLEKEWYRLTAHEDIYDEKDPIGVLDVAVLQKQVLDPILGIKDPRTDSRIDFVGGIRGLEELERRVDNGEMEVAFAIYPVTMEQLFEVADSGNIMPPKSTWFEPKLRDGLLTHLI